MSAVQADFSLGRINQPGEKFEKSGFTRAVGSQERDAFSRDKIEVQIPERPA